MHRPSSDLYSTPISIQIASISRPNTSRPTTGQTRPRTGQTRQGTARPTTSASVRHDGSYVIALLEGRGVAREVGFAALDRDTGRVILVQLADCQTYVETLHQMHLHPPVLVLVPDTFLSTAEGTTASLLVEFIYEEFPGVPVEPIGRKYWNETGGVEFIS
ncbi:hypothetical protein C8J57DRAFT_1620051 [Mycena rebaudengoi]|nr:hypothetical protein C8J57DRAFT_1620051 [Mycena rebaudengoi]